MRFMLLMIPANHDVRETPPSVEKAAMGTYNESLQQAGILLAFDRLLPPSTGARISFPGKKATVRDGPFAEAKEAIGGCWMIQVKTREEAVEWAKRCPALEGDVIEVRQVEEG